MSYWRKLFIVVLLALSLPVQSFAAVSMKCVPTHARAGDASVRHAGHEMSEHHREMHGMVLAGDGDRHDPRGSLHVHSCSMCASCCLGTALPAVPIVAVIPDATRVVASIPPSAGAASFLTGGIERPPRSRLV